ncbi:NAD(P) transhydrogenase subunit alpha (Nicotinamide nucleotide transhydrogenase subunit alpha) (Pyridine nucleotide transhydrogenase subunit alpha) [Durusdinium trenchii]|uniref:proton-translocating NAD(P)(+) transhydrogenase n=1 Tax=Durusdinium trenchii TaxID=1381693 RepID=A0ABP0J8E0_9DINO
MATTAPLLQNDTHLSFKTRELQQLSLALVSLCCRLPQASAGAAIALELGILHEGDQRVSMAPDVAEQLIKDGYGDSQLQRVLFSIEPPEADFPACKGKAVCEKAKAAGVMLVDVTAVPRITIAQKLDVLSSQAKCAGHRAVIEASYAFGRFHTAEMTAAGKYPPSQTFILGCGVAGLAAIGTSKAMGSVVRAWDVRDVSDQVHSMGAKWVTVDFKESGEGQGGYAKESSDAFKKVQQETFRKVLAECDIAISTAAIPGRPSPLLITKEAVAGMKPGSVIVDLAAQGGGNCELTKLNEIVTTANGVTIIGYADMPARNLLRHIHGKGKAADFMKNFLGALDAGSSCRGG